MLRPKRRPSSRQGGFLRSDRRPNPRESGSGSSPDGDADAPATEAGGAPEVRIRRSAAGSPPVAKITTLGVLLFMVLAVIFLL